MLGVATLVYAVMAAIGALGMDALGVEPFGDAGLRGALAGAAAGVALAAVVVLGTRAMAARWAWARALALDLGPAARSLPAWAVVATALASGVAEELFFRGMLVSLAGVAPAALAFGLLHQVRGRSRWVWAGFAASMGLVLGGLFVATGSLLGPIIAHVSINFLNLRWLRAHVTSS